jgi:hypothetical protein
MCHAESFLVILCASCHSERSEESHALGTEILRCAQNDKARALRMTKQGRLDDQESSCQDDAAADYLQERHGLMEQ